MSREEANVTRVSSIEGLHGPAGRLEALLNSGRADAKYAAIVCHPHPKGGGTMHNKVVYHAMKTFSALGLPVVRFNFRGVGLSEGEHDEGRGERDDVRAVLDWMEAELKLPILFAGFSFGSNVGMRACCGDPRIKGLVGLGVPVQAEGREYSYGFLEQCVGPKLFISGDQDQYGPQEQVKEALSKAAGPKELHWIAGADHFFQGTVSSPGAKLDVMQGILRAWLLEQFGLE